MNNLNPSEKNQGSLSDTKGKKTRLRNWVAVIVAVVVIIVGYALITNWENFSRGLAGEPETTH